MFFLFVVLYTGFFPRALSSECAYLRHWTASFARSLLPCSVNAFSDAYATVLSGLNGSLAVSVQSCQLLFISSPPQFGSWEDVSTDVLERQKKPISY